MLDDDAPPPPPAPGIGHEIVKAVAIAGLSAVVTGAVTWGWEEVKAWRARRSAPKVAEEEGSK